MMQILKPLLIISTSYVMIFAACSGNNRNISLQYNLEEGRNFRRKMVTEQTVKQEFQGETQVVVNTVKSVMNYKVIENDGNQTELEVRYDTMEIIVQLPGRTMRYSSGGNFWKKDDLFSQLLNSMSGKSFNIVVNNKSGKISEVKGLAELFQEVLADFVTGSSEQMGSVMEMLNKSYGETAFIDSFEATNAYLTEGKVKKGDSWEVSTDLANLGGKITSTWEIKEMGSDKAILTGNGTFDMLNKDREKEIEGVTTNLELNGTQISNLTIDSKSAWPLEGKIKQNLKGEMKLLNPQTGETANLPLEMINVITYSTIE